MSEYNKSYRISELLARSAIHELSAEEMKAIVKWASESSENLRIYEKWKSRESLPSEYDAYNTIDSGKVRTDMRIRIDNAKHSKRRRLALSISAAACAAAIMLVGGLMLLRDDVRSEIQHLSDAVPTLYFDDGREVPLDNTTLILKNGEIIIENNDGHSEIIPIGTDGQQIYTTLKVPRGSVYDVVLDDGTQVWLNAESELRYPVSFGRGSREVSLNGEAYFKVTYDKSRPFYVKTAGQNLEVLGTEFNISAYNEAAEVMTTLVSGSVRLTTPTSGGQMLTPGQQAVLADGSELFRVREVDTKQFTAWKDGIIVIDEQTFEYVLSTIARAYNVEFAFSDEQIKDIVFKGRIPKYDDLWRVLDILQEMSGVKFKIKGTTIYVK